MMRLVGLIAICLIFPSLLCCTAQPKNSGLAYLDAHIHFWDVDVHQGLKNWPGEQNKILYRTFLPKHYLPEARELGITQTVMVQSGNSVEEIRWAVKVSEPHADAFPGLVFNFNASIGTPEFDALYAEAKKSDRFVGIRTLGGKISPNNEQLEQVIADLQQIAHDNKSLDILTFGCKLEDIAALAKRLPDLRIMVNAMGMVGQHKKTPQGPSQVWIKDIQALAKHENISIKLTGHTMTGVEDPENPEYLRPYYKALLQSVGPKRLVWASDWPTILNAQETLRMTTVNPPRLLKDLPQSQQRDIFQNNAARFYSIAVE